MRVERFLELLENGSLLKVEHWSSAGHGCLLLEILYKSESCLEVISDS